MIKIGSEGTELALWQAKHLQAELQKHGFQSTTHVIKTVGNEIHNSGIQKIADKATNSNEIESALINHEIDIAVNSMMDLPTVSHEKICITAVSYREDPNDSLVIKASKLDFSKAFGLSEGLIVGCSSLRQRCLINHFCNAVITKPLSADISIDIKKFRAGEFDAIILAKAALNQLGIEFSDTFKTIHMNPREFIPAPAQGIIAYRCRIDDTKTRKIAQVVHHSDVSRVSNVERKLQDLFSHENQIPLGAYCFQDKNAYYHAHAFCAKDENSKPKFASLSQSSSAELARRLYDELNA